MTYWRNRCYKLAATLPPPAPVHLCDGKGNFRDAGAIVKRRLSEEMMKAKTERPVHFDTDLISKTNLLVVSRLGVLRSRFPAVSPSTSGRRCSTNTLGWPGRGTRRGWWRSGLV